MTRTNQASEPTMEEILASIRLIISDDAKKGPKGPEDHPNRLAPARVDAAPLNALPEEEVLDLTDALAPEEQPSPNGPSRSRERYVMPAAAPHEEPGEEQPHAQEDAIEAEPEPAQEADMQPEEAQPSSEPRHDLSRPMSPASRTIWSRRELPGSPPPVAAPVPRYEAPARQPQRNWAQDIQMPISDRGPVSLIPAQAQPHVHNSGDEREAADQMEAESDGDQPHGLGEREAAVAAIAESLARTAAEAMNSEELATAGDVDFSKLGEEQKAEVTETFANAIQRESAPRDKNPLPTLLDEVLRQDFIREPSPEEEPAEDSPETEASSAHEESYEKAEDERFSPKWGAPEIALQAAASRQPAPQVRSELPSRASETLAPQERTPGRIVPAPQPDPERSAASGSPLEAAVRDMLQPLLEQWLDKHMPRVLESAIREEIAARGLLPKTEK